MTVNLCRLIIDILPAFIPKDSSRAKALKEVFQGEGSRWSKEAATECLKQMNSFSGSDKALRKVSRDSIGEDTAQVVQSYMVLVNLIHTHLGGDRPRGFQLRGLSIDGDDLFTSPRTRAEAAKGEVILYMDQNGLTLNVSSSHCRYCCFR